MGKKKISLTEYSDFHYLLELLPLLYDDPRYESLPELFSIIGHENLILLSKYAGGSVIRIPRIDELNESIEALEWYYKVYIDRTKQDFEVPLSLRDSVEEIRRIISARGH